VAYLVVTTLVPFVALVLMALTRAVGLPPVPENLTLDNFAAAVGPRTGGAVMRSVGLALAAASLTLVLSGIVIALARRRGARVLTIAATLMFALPGSTVAIGVLIAYGGLLRDTLALILLAYLAKLWAVALRPVQGSVERLPSDLLHAARASGASAGDTLRSVAIPVLRPTIVAAWLLVFLFGVHELTMSSLLYGPGTATFAVVVLDQQQLGDPTVTSALGVLLTLLVLIAALPLVVMRRALPLGLGGR
jgi:iron(III) transport system permease protein